MPAIPDREGQIAEVADRHIPETSAVAIGEVRAHRLPDGDLRRGRTECGQQFHQTRTIAAIRGAAAGADFPTPGQAQAVEFPAPGDAGAGTERDIRIAAIGGKFEGHRLDLRRSAATQPLDPACGRRAEALDGRSVGQPRHPAAHDAAHAEVKVAVTSGDEHPAIRLHGHTPNGVVRVGIEAAIQRAVGMKPGDAVPRGAANGGEIAAEYHLAVRLERQGVNAAVQVGIEGAIQRPIRVDTCKVAAKVPPMV